jgi:hypothetical protein
MFAGALLVAAAALALQPDRAMAGMLAASLACLALLRPARQTLIAAAGAVLAFGTTLALADTLPAVPYVDRILYTAFDVHALAGAAVLLGAALLLVPALLGSWGDPENRATHVLFGIAWAAAVAAAALGNYPTPIVGYGGSAILGYLLSVAALPRTVAGQRVAGASARQDERDAVRDRHLRLQAAPA